MCIVALGYVVQISVRFSYSNVIVVCLHGHFTEYFLCGHRQSWGLTLVLLICHLVHQSLLIFREFSFYAVILNFFIHPVLWYSVVVAVGMSSVLWYVGLALWTTPICKNTITSSTFPIVFCEIFGGPAATLGKASRWLFYVYVERQAWLLQLCLVACRSLLECLLWIIWYAMLMSITIWFVIYLLSWLIMIVCSGFADCLLFH